MSDELGHRRVTCQKATKRVDLFQGKIEDKMDEDAKLFQFMSINWMEPPILNESHEKTTLSKI